MATINISLPIQLKSEAEALVRSGKYISFSDLVRDALRKVISRNEYDVLPTKAKSIDIKTKVE